MLVLRDDRIIETIAKLQRRISERFPDAGLARLCGELLDVARQASQRSAWIAKPIIWIRVCGYLIAPLLVLLLVPLIRMIGLKEESLSLSEFVQTFEAGLNEVLVLGAAIYSLITLETRIKRRRALAAIHELRSIAHIIDMHQLTKDPERVLRTWQRTEHSPAQKMTPLQLNRYLDYCSEMLSLTGKIAALYVKDFDDAVSVAAVSEVEQICTSMSRKIWQKLMILHQTTESLTTSTPSGGVTAANIASVSAPNIESSLKDSDTDDPDAPSAVHLG